VNDLSGAELRSRLRNRGLSEDAIQNLVWWRDDPEVMELLTTLLDGGKVPLDLLAESSEDLLDE
jgi:hypothetical protein